MDGRLNHLTRAEREVLWVMALNALDQETNGTEAGLYFRGWAHIAACIGYGGKEWEPGAERAVARAIKGLTDKGFIKAEGHLGGRASPMVYRLTL